MRSYLALLWVPLCWGTSFPLLKLVVDGLSPPLALGLRFALAALAFTPFAGSLAQRRQARPMGVCLGLLYAAIYALVAQGLRQGSSPRVGFLMGLSVVWVPLLAAVRQRRWPRLVHLAAGALSLAGLATLCRFRFTGLGPGEAGVVLAALLFALTTVVMHVATSERALQPFALLQTQCAVTAVCWLPAIVASAWAAPVAALAALAATPWWLWLALIYGALLPTVACQLLIARHLPVVGPAVAASLFVLQSVFTSLTATCLFGEPLAPRALVGGLLIVAASLLPAAAAALSARRTAASAP